MLLMGAAALGRVAVDAQKRDMLVRSARPEDLEMPLSGFSDYITPIDRFFVRTHVYAPRVDVAQWRLKVDGDVAAPLTLTMDDLRRLPSVELVSVLECAGNGRGFYEPSVPGLQWANGAVGNGRWRGVRLADVLKRAGVQGVRQEILFNGADVPIGTMPDFQRSIPGHESARCRHAARLRDERRDAAGRAWLPAARRGAGLGRRFVDQMGDVDSRARQENTTGSGWRAPTGIREAGAARHRRPSRADAAGDQPARQERHRRPRCGGSAASLAGR